MNFIGKISVKSSRKERRKKASLTIGIFCIALAMIIELFFSPFASLALVVPFSILLNLRWRMGRSKYIKDVDIHIEHSEFGRTIMISNSVFRKNILCSCRYSIPESECVYTSFDKASEQIEIIFKGKAEYFYANTTIENDNKIIKRNVKFMVSYEDALAISNALSSVLI